MSLEKIVEKTSNPNDDVAPSDIDLSATENQLFSVIGREHALREVLHGWAEKQYDYILIDCPPTLGLLTLNALVASDGVIIPVQTQYYSLKGFTALNAVITQIRAKGLNPRLRVLGLLPTFYDSRTNLGRDMLAELGELGDHHIFEAIVRQTVRLGEAPLVGKPVTSYASKSGAADTYRGLAREVIELG
jgi:chromosome partitioning protein